MLRSYTKNRIGRSRRGTSSEFIPESHLHGDGILLIGLYFPPLQLLLLCRSEITQWVWS